MEHLLIKFCIHWNTYSKSCMVFQFYPITFDLGWHWKVKSRSLGINLAVYHRQVDIISVAKLSGREASCLLHDVLWTSHTFDLWWTFLLHDVLLTSWRTSDVRHVYFLEVMSTFWHYDILFEVTTHFRRHDVISILLSFHTSILEITTYFVT